MAASALVLSPTTPTDYHRIVSPTLRIPTNLNAPIPVGLLACQRDPLLRDLLTTIVSCTLSQPVAAPANNRKKKGASAAPAEPLLEVILHDTILFPEGGGQPSDIGIITTADGETWDVTEVKRHGGHAVHYVRTRNPSTDLSAFPAGARVGVALGDDGFKRRHDHMSMHTSQHLLSALLETRLNLPTLSWALTTYPTPSYVEIPRSMTLEEISFIQDAANQLVFEGRKIHVEVEELNREQLQDAPKLENGRSVGKALPADYTGGVKRTVVIDGVDRNPCCGTHLPSLHNLQIFLLPHTESLARSTSTSARLYFLSGPRLLAHLSSSHALLTNTSSILSCGAPQVPERVAQVVEERKKAEKRVEDIEIELAGLIAKDMVKEMELTVNDEKGMFMVRKHRTDDSTAALQFLSSISSLFVSMLTSTERPYLIVLSSSPTSQTPNSTSVVFIFGSDDKKVREVGDQLKANLGVRGGGKGTRWSGKFSGVWKDNKENAVIDDIFNTARGVHM